MLVLSPPLSLSVVLLTSRQLYKACFQRSYASLRIPFIMSGKLETGYHRDDCEISTLALSHKHHFATPFCIGFLKIKSLLCDYDKSFSQSSTLTDLFLHSLSLSLSLWPETYYRQVHEHFFASLISSERQRVAFSASPHGAL